MTKHGITTKRYWITNPTQNIKGALSFYQQAVQMENGNILKFQEQFSQDVADLLIAGIEEAEVALMLDQLRYKIEGAI